MHKRLMLPLPEGVEDFHIVDRGSHLELVSLRVCRGRQGFGHGSAALNRLKELRRTIKLVASPDKPHDMARLHRFYRANGFTDTHNRDVPGEMQWTPAAQVVEVQPNPYVLALALAHTR